MMSNNLIDEYKKLNPFLKKLYVVPLINYHIKNSDYLYLLYKQLLDDNSPDKTEIVNLSAAGHYKLASKGINSSVLHYHWFEVSDFQSLIGICWKIFWIWIYKLAGGKIVWTVHNKHPHTDRFFAFNRFLQKFMGRIADRLHVHCSAAIDIMAPFLKVEREKFFVIPHPEYCADLMNRSEAVEALTQNYPQLKINNSQKVFLSFGAIARYKCIEGIIRSVTELKDCVLVVAGPVKKGNEAYFEELKKKSRDNQNVFLINKVIPDEDVKYFFNAADAVIFNYRDILTSGGVVLALDYKKTVIAPAMGCISDINDNNLLTFQDSESLKSILLKVTESN